MQLSEPGSPGFGSVPISGLVPSDGTARTAAVPPSAVDELEELVRFVIRHTAALSGMSIQALSTLGALAGSGPLRITDLASLEGVSQPSMTTMVNRLEKLGLVVRRVDPTDGRGTLIGITAAGREVRERRRASRSAFLASLIGRLEPDEVAALDRVAPLLGRLADREALPAAVAAARRAGGEPPTDDLAAASPTTPATTQFQTAQPRTTPFQATPFQAIHPTTKDAS